MRKYTYEEDDNQPLGPAFDILDPDGDHLALVGSKVEATNLKMHLNHPRGEYKSADTGRGRARFAINDEDGNTLAFVPNNEVAAGLLSHLNRNN